MKKVTPDWDQPQDFALGGVVRLRDDQKGRWEVVEVLWRQMDDGRPSHWVYGLLGVSRRNVGQRIIQPTWLLVDSITRELPGGGRS